MDSPDAKPAVISDVMLDFLSSSADRLIASGKLGGRPRPKYDLIHALAPIIRKLRENGAHWKQVETFLLDSDIHITRKTIQEVMEELDGAATQTSPRTDVRPASESRSQRQRNDIRNATEISKPTTKGRRGKRKETPLGTRNASSDGATHERDASASATGTRHGSALSPEAIRDHSHLTNEALQSSGNATDASGSNGTGDLDVTRDSTTGLFPKIRSHGNGVAASEPIIQPALALKTPLPPVSRTSAFESTKRNFG